MTKQPDIKPVPLIDRLVDQARDYGQLYLTTDEAQAVADTLRLCPKAAVGYAPGQIIDLADLTIHILPPLDPPTRRRRRKEPR